MLIDDEDGGRGELRQKGNIHPQQSLLTDQKKIYSAGWGGHTHNQSSWVGQNAANAITKIRMESKRYERIYMTKWREWHVLKVSKLEEVSMLLLGGGEVLDLLGRGVSSTRKVCLKVY